MRDLRQEYKREVLREDNVLHDPIAQFHRWFEEAVTSEVIEPNAFTLSTVDAEGNPASRVVLLKDVTEAGFTFYTNYTSDKGREIAAHPTVAANFLWKPLERQVRLVGAVGKVSREDSEAYFHSRPRGSQIGAWASRQSSIIEGPEVLDEQLAYYAKKFADYDVVPLPDDWGGFCIKPHYIEFWQGRPSRLHDRLRYIKQENGSWKIVRLSP